MNTPILNKTVTYKRGTSSKFWHVEVAGKKLTTTWGRIGADGQSKVEVFKTPTLAITKAQALLSEKLKKGYTEAIARTKGTRSTTARGSEPAAPQPAERKSKKSNKTTTPRKEQDIRKAFSRMIAELKTNPRIKVHKAQINPRASAGDIKEASRLAGGKLPSDVEAFYTKANGLHVKWEVIDKRLRVGNSLLDVGEIHVLPLLGKLEAVFASWRDWVWFDYSHPQLKLVKPIDFLGESGASLYPVPGKALLYYHIITSSTVYPLGIDFAAYLALALEARGLQGWQATLCPELKGAPEVENFLRVAPALFENFEQAMFRSRTKLKKTRFLKK